MEKPKRRKKKKASDAGIQARVKHDMEINLRMADQREALKAQGLAQWAENQFRKANLRADTVAGRKAREDEIRMANREQTILRRNRLRELFEADIAEWQSELEKKGLAIIM